MVDASALFPPVQRWKCDHFLPNFFLFLRGGCTSDKVRVLDTREIGGIWLSSSACPKRDDIFIVRFIPRQVHFAASISRTPTKPCSALKNVRGKCFRWLVSTQINTITSNFRLKLWHWLLPRWKQKGNRIFHVPCCLYLWNPLIKEL